MTTTYATQVTAYFLSAIAAAEAGGAMVNIAGGTMLVGDGSGVVPSISALIAANGVTHQVWSGPVAGVSVDSNNAAQLDIQCVVPASVGGVEVGPFAVTEFAILDALGNCCVVGTTNLYKSVSGLGMTTNLAWTAAVVNGVGAVTVTPPSAGFTTLGAVIAAYDSNLPSAVAPLTQTDTIATSGWRNRVFGARLASQPADPVTSLGDAAGIGVGRPASAAEFAALAPTSGDFAWPWPTLQQIAAMIAALTPLTFHVQAQRASGVAATSLAGTTWTVWDLNATILNEIPGASLGFGGQFTLPAGKYKASFAGQAFSAGSHYCRLYNFTAGAVIVEGLRGDSYVGAVTSAVSNVTNPSVGECVFTLTATSVLQLQHYSFTSGTGATMGDQGTGASWDAFVLIETRP